MCSTCEAFEARLAAGTLSPDWGRSSVGRALAWHARGFRGFESHRLHLEPSTFLASWRRLGFFLGGFVAGEGWFVVDHRSPPRRDGFPRLRFRFGVTVATRDRPILDALRMYLGVGSVHDSPAQRASWQPTSTLAVASFRGHRTGTIPFADKFLIPSAKRDQYVRWRDGLLRYDEARPRRQRSKCSELDCEGLVRGRGLCRSHYYRATGY